MRRLQSSAGNIQNTAVGPIYDITVFVAIDGINRLVFLTPHLSPAWKRFL